MSHNKHSNTVFSLFVITSRFHIENTKLQCNFDGCDNTFRSICQKIPSNFTNRFAHSLIHVRHFFSRGRSIISGKRRQRALLVDHAVRQVLLVASLIHRDTPGEHTAISRCSYRQRSTLSNLQIFLPFSKTQSNNIVAYYSPNSSQSNQTLCDVDRKWSLYDR